MVIARICMDGNSGAVGFELGYGVELGFEVEAGVVFGVVAGA